ncbi:flavodoxin [Streptomyces virginiae]|uniref:flavodoxin n=1 Tax=Streptomyces virginiae TaxID=1961 RepID=UPI0037A866F8
MAETMAEVVDARVVLPEEVAGHDLVGFGSGVFAQQMHPGLLAFVRALPASLRRAASRSRRSRRTTVRWCGSSTTRDSRSREFSPTARSTRGRSFRLIGDINKQRPNEDDLIATREFAERLAAGFACTA